jgi:hypothetical protein
LGMRLNQVARRGTLNALISPMIYEKRGRVIY